MKFCVTMKDPDTLQTAIDDAVSDNLPPELENDGERDAVRERRCEKVADACRKWFEYDEYLTVEIDTEKMTCTVIPV